LKKRVTMDFETRSRVELTSKGGRMGSGAYKYSLDPSTRPTCLAFKEHGSQKVFFLDFKLVNTPWRDLPPALKLRWIGYIRDGYEFSGHNAFFETCIYKNILVRRYGWPDIPFRRFRCTAAKAAACALPRNLEGAGSAMELSVQKDKRGYVAMMATCKPTRKWNDWTKARAERAAGKKIGPRKLQLADSPEPPVFLEPEMNPEIWDTLYTYCKIDVLAEEKLDEALPDLIASEQEIWFLNQKLNWRGLRIDIPTVRKVVGILESESKVRLKELDTLTMGLVTKPGARKSILEFLALEGVELPDIKATTVDDVLKAGKISSDMKRLLEIRKELSKTSTKKFQGMIIRADDDEHVRDILLYHGAGTGRDTGVGLQPHNFPRGVIKVDYDRPYAAVENVKELDVDMLKLLYGDSLPVLFSSILRNMIIPDEGMELFVADFSKIEVAVLWWLAGNKEGLEILASGKDPYIYQAAKNLNKTYEEIEAAVKAGEKWAEDARQLGKAQILGCGFGMGADKFLDDAWARYRLKLTEEQSREAITNYREKNAAVPQLWKDYERAVIMAVEDDVTVEIGRSKFFKKNGFLWISLPSGRRLAYRKPEIIWRETEYGPRKAIQFWGVNSKTKKWTTERTWGGTIAENITQATARDLMMPAMLRLEKAKYQALLMVHDEGLCQRKLGRGSVEEFTRIMCEAPNWGKDIPIDAKGWKGPRYRK
jgi:DNA polymerase